MSKTAKIQVLKNGSTSTGHAAEKAVLNPAEDFGFLARSNARLSLAAIFNTMRILKKVNPGDAYYENYLSMRQKYGANFFDTYQVLWAVGVYRSPRRILEIGTRTGISLCQLLSSYIDLNVIEKVVCVDPFDEWTSPNLVRANLSYLNIPPEKVDIFALKSEDFFKLAVEKAALATTFDFILVDGDHTKKVAHADLESAHKLLEKGGVVIFDDISTAPGECGLLDVWEAWIEAHKADYYSNSVMSGKGVAWAIRK